MNLDNNNTPLTIDIKVDDFITSDEGFSPLGFENIMVFKVLIVDDDQTILNLVSKMILEYDPNIQILVAQNCLQAIDLLRNEPIDFVICDYNLPDGTGDEILQNPALKGFRVGMSGDPFLPEFKKIYDTFLQKPFRMQEIHSLLKKNGV